MWGGRALVVGFAGGEIEKVSILTFANCSGRSQPANNQFLWIATAQPSASETRLGHRDLLGLLSQCDTFFLVSSLRLAEIPPPPQIRTLSV